LKETFVRVLGYVSLAIGILFLVLLVLAEFGGAHLSVLPFVVSIFLVSIGASLVKSGKGIVQATPASNVESEGHLTVELPMSPEVAAVIDRQSARSWRFLLYLAGGFIVFFIGMGAVLGLADKTPGEIGLFVGLFGSVGVATAIMIVGIGWLTTRGPMSRDLRAPSYLRTTGPIRVVTIWGGATLRLADRAFLMNGKAGISELSKLDAGSVDYTSRGHVILAAWDREGRSVYCAPGYNVKYGA
jgi:hypothetical protein